MYVKISNGSVSKYPYSFNDLKNDNPQTSFPEVVSDSFLESWGVYRVTETTAPSVDHTKTVFEKNPELIESSWTQSWQTLDKSPEEIQQAVDSQWDSIRAERNQKLSSCDWTQLPDSPLTNTQQLEWATYRQALRDITNQADPFNITWPTKP